MRWNNKSYVAREDEVPPPTPHEITISRSDPYDSVYYPAPPRGRMNRLTTTFQSYGRTPSLFFHNYRHPQPMNDSLYNLYSTANDSDYLHHARPSSPVKPAYDEEKLKNDLKNEIKHELRNEQKDDDERKRRAEPAIPIAAACGHQDCGKDRDQAFPSDEKQYCYGDTRNMNRNVDDGSTVVVPMFNTKEEEMQKQAMHRGRFYEMLNRQPHSWFPLFSYLSALGMAVALVASIIQNRQMTGSVIELSPFNVMLGPSAQTLVHAGARYSPCMRGTDLTKFECSSVDDEGGLSPPSMILSIDTGNCTIHDTCGMTSFGEDPNQAYRVITAIFVHSGILHYFLNMTIQLGLGRRVERRLNPLRYGFVWLIGGIFGNIVSTTFSPVSSATMGCSGSLFSVLSLLLIDLLRSWRLIADPGWQLIKLVTLFALGLAYGYLPGPDNFAHLGGFVAGLLVGLVIMPSNKMVQTKGQIIFKWMIRVIAIILLGVACYLLLNTFYKGQKPEELFSWCKYLACLPINDMCSIYNVS
ncbi:rhomboid family-domain-containing protein [Fennellomyces sp. T-0311]|nr:rhomboid family-domain-containing protein [Fennellomyces sp. T-0311]